MIILAGLAFLLVLALVATQLKLRALAESISSEQVRIEAQRTQYERDTRTLETECEGLVVAAEARCNRWKQIYSASRGLMRSTEEESAARMAELFAAAGHFRVVAVRARDPQTHNFVLQHLLGMPAEAADRLRETRVPDPIVREWLNLQNAFGPGFILRTKALPNPEPNSPGGPLGPQDALLIPFRNPEGRVELYISLAQPEPCRLPDSDEMSFYQAATDFASAHLARLSREVDSAFTMGTRLRESQMEAVAVSAYRDTMMLISNRIRSGLSNVEGYARTVLDYGAEIPRNEQGRLATAIVEESEQLRDDIMLVSDMAELTGPEATTPGEQVEFSDLYAELLQFLLHRAESKGVALNGPPLQGGVYLDRPAGLMKRLLALTSNELLSCCGKGHELSLTAWQDQGQVHISWRASGHGITPPDPEARTPRWVAAQAMAHAMGGSLRESTFGADNRSVNLSLPLARGQRAPEQRAA